MNHTTDELESLILKNCSEMKFEYGGDSATFGNADCRIMLRKTNDDSPMYSGVVCTNHRIDDESRQLAYEVSLSNGDVLACGRLSGGGRFVFPHSTAADGHECRLTIGRSQKLRRPTAIPVSLRRSIRPAFATGGIAGDRRTTSTDRGAVRLVGPNVVVRVAACDLPFDLLVLTASDKSNNVIGKHLIHLPANGNSHGAVRTASLDASFITGTREPDECSIYAWGLTASAETYAVVTEEMLNSVAAVSAEAKKAVAYFRTIKNE